MGIGKVTSDLLMLESQRRPFEGTVLQLGRQDLYFDFAKLQRFAKEKQYTLTAGVTPIIKTNPWVGLQVLDDPSYFKFLGFTDVKSVDFSDYEKADYIADLNTIAENLPKENFDVIFDGGTTEHVFHTPNVLANIHRCLKVGGRIVHMLPTGNHVDHGFYQFSPTFFVDYYAANGYDINMCKIAQLVDDDENADQQGHIYDYIPGSIGHLAAGGWSKRQLLTFFVGTKRADSTCDRVPQQNIYRSNFWKPGASTQEQVENLIPFDHHIANPPPPAPVIAAPPVQASAPAAPTTRPAIAKRVFRRLAAVSLQIADRF